jgi:hypothetical protein
MATRKVSTGYYTEGKRVMEKKIKKNSLWYINTTEVIQSGSYHFKFKCVLWYGAQKLRYIFNGYIFKNSNGYMDRKQQTQKQSQKRDK